MSSVLSNSREKIQRRGKGRRRGEGGRGRRTRGGEEIAATINDEIQS